MGTALCTSPGHVKDDASGRAKDHQFDYHSMFVAPQPQPGTYPSANPVKESSSTSSTSKDNSSRGRAAPQPPTDSSYTMAPQPSVSSRASSSVKGNLVKGSEWDSADFIAQLEQARASGNTGLAKKVLVQVAESNYALRNRWKVPRTGTVSYQKCKDTRVRGKGKDPIVSFSVLSTADAVLALAQNRQKRLCALNFANGEHVGGGYKTGATAQEEDLCRRIPSLYSTLYNASKSGLYPFGPCTTKSSSKPEKYAEVLYTNDLVVARASEALGYTLLSPSEQANVSLVTAAAPNVNFANEIYDLELMYNTIHSVFVAPVLEDPTINTLILGAWGCGAFGGKPEDVSELFCRAFKDGLGRLYDEVHFAIPEGHNADVFRQVLGKHNIKLAELTASGVSSIGRKP